jgi:DNA-binding CsgD family transcriptional regulator
VVGSRRDLVVSGEAVVAVDADLRVVSWNSAAEELTGVAADDALGQPCWLVLRGQSPRGAVLCHRDCSVTRYARRGYPVARQNMNIATTSGPRSVSVSTVVFRDRREPLLLHVLQDGEQDEVAEGVTARRIADRLGLAEATVRNHIRAVLSELGAHSQLEAVARARAQGLV